jgi:hypothetical protein
MGKVTKLLSQAAYNHLELMQSFTEPAYRHRLLANPRINKVPLEHLLKGIHVSVVHELRPSIARQMVCADCSPSQGNQAAFSDK